MEPMALPRTITIMNQHERGSKNRRASVGTSSDASAEWASAYLSHWFEECDAASGRGRRRSCRPRADSPVPAERPRTFHGHDSRSGELMSTRDLLSSLRTLDCWRDSRKGGEGEDGAHHVSSKSSKSSHHVRHHCSSGSGGSRRRGIESLSRGGRDSAYGSRRSRSADSFSFVDMSDPSYSMDHRRLSRSCPKDPTDSDQHQQARKVHFAESADGDGTANHQDSGEIESAAVPLNNPPVQNENLPAMSGPRTRILNLPWTDHHGFQAYYSGGVNVLIQPHGFGTLVYQDGRVVQSMWNNGTSLQDDWHHRWKKKRSASCTYRRSSGAPNARDAPAAGADPVDRKPSRSFEAGTADREASRSPSCIRELAGFPALPFRPPRRYDLGDVGAPEDMVVEPDPVRAHRNASSLKVHDFAFVLRRNGTWTYAVVAAPKEGARRASLRFVMNAKGSTKTVEGRHWAKYVRLVNWNRDDDKEDDAGDDCRDAAALPSNDGGAPHSRSQEHKSKVETGETPSLASDQAIFPWQHHTSQGIRGRGGKARCTRPRSSCDAQSCKLSASCPDGELFGSEPSC